MKLALQGLLFLLALLLELSYRTKKKPKKASSFTTQKSHKKNRHITAPPKLQKTEAKTENTKKHLPFFYKPEDTEKSHLLHIP